jgi:hypothetical protein
MLWASDLKDLDYPIGSWRLPTRSELAEICAQKELLDGYDETDYYGSEVSPDGSRYYRNFMNCAEGSSGDEMCVRAVRDDLIHD